MPLIESLEAENAALVNPLAGPAPGGVDVSFLPEFEPVKAELDKMGSISGGAPNWKLVEEKSRELLATTTKDLRLIAWLIVARTHGEGFRGLASGLVVLRSFARDLWGVGFPEARRARARANLYAWMTENVHALIESRQVSEEDREVVAVVEKLFGEVDAIVSEKLGDAHPGLGRLRGTIRNMTRALSAEAPPPGPATAPAIAGAAPPPPVAPAPSPVTGPSPPATATATAGAVGAPANYATPASQEESRVNLERAVAAILEVAQFRRKAAPEEVGPYRMLREALWLALERPPPTTEGQRTRLRGPPAPTMRRIEGHFSAERWRPLLDDAEYAAATNVFWLDAHRYSALALERLGLGKAREEVGRQIVRLVQRVPDLLRRQYVDETPFASPDAVSWIEGETRRFAATQSSEAPGDKELDDAMRAAEELAGSGQLGDALNIVVERAFRAGSGRERFRAVMRASRLALERGAAELARPMLDGLFEDVEKHALEVWDPALCVDLYRMLIQALRAESGANVDRSQREAVLFEKLCRLDPRAALVLARR